ncbi:hypothetical protein C0Q70_01269 [Pomacea canaliculata]|uniref:Uncharacterized protein n=1 Tax=Pomacea canaliculata TaxID=400727 RepID=A0A2T7PZ11_POMCA|nr:hypothetical protein C0Q70_01269 [Pomacea canaliculata]
MHEGQLISGSANGALSGDNDKGKKSIEVWDCGGSPTYETGGSDINVLSKYSTYTGFTSLPYPVSYFEISPA